jgi:hypothetical protein
MTKSDAELKQLILNRRARFVAAAMCSSGIVLSACQQGEGEILGTTVGVPTPTNSTSTSVGPTACLSTAAPTPVTTTPPTACLAAPSPTPCLSIVEIPPIIVTPPSEPTVCLSPPFSSEPLPPTTGFAKSSSADIADAGADAAPSSQPTNAESTSSAVESTAPASPLDAAIESTSTP